MDKVSVIGAGAWGTALAASVAQTAPSVQLWCRDPALAADIRRLRQNSKYLPDIPLPDTLDPTSDLEAVCRADIILAVIPAQHLRTVLESMAGFLSKDTALVLCAKGIEQSTGKLLSEMVEEVLPGQPYGILSGPNFAHEVAKGLPAATTLAIQDQKWGTRIVKAIGHATFRPYLTDDVIGAQLGGATKNVLAIACGIVAGAKLGENARAALITRGMAEILRLGDRLGARAETLMGLSGFGDLVLTCSSVASRNYSLGFALGEGKTLEEILSSRHSVTEGVYTAAALDGLAKTLDIEMPICQAVHAVLTGRESVRQAAEHLLSRPFRDEKLAGFH
ncbi:NAD(P)H-dependent glycerol-3-phosphate dehydrogenase [Sneathiella chinensis]|uniref:Glycerol-3-phosphate dehydrogenase [NAD(P)+] n=1 Tax=Sneathiella chinensis TaxID=349750 RepID=A0ABQ5TZJ9_9PROT|nr:NAD(P)H-dependent glycerol-3-phosphate dehydrogenase [Sneathiella chinensis]GLQ05039.1 glycerol-3-phosphate dehydrogenase [NAD(P)+] [Sneathiella chinensis]